MDLSLSQIHLYSRDEARLHLSLCQLSSLSSHFSHHVPTHHEPDLATSSTRCPSALALAIDLAQHNIGAAQNRDDIAHFMPAQQFGQNLQVHKRRTAQLGSPGILAAIADEVHAQLALAALKREVGLAARRAQRDRCARADGTAGHLVDGDAAEADALKNLIEAHFIACKAVALLAHDDIHRNLAVRAIGTIDAQIPFDAAGTQHRTGQTIGDGLLLIDIAHALSAGLKDLIAGNQPSQLDHILLKLVEEGRTLREPAFGKIVQHAADANVVHIKAAAAQRLKERENALAVAEGPQNRRHSPQVHQIGADAHQVAGNPLQLVGQQTNILRTAWRLDIHQLLNRTGIRGFVQHRRQVIAV